MPGSHDGERDGFSTFVKLSTTTLALLMTEERESHPCPLMVEQ